MNHLLCRYFALLSIKSKAFLLKRALNSYWPLEKKQFDNKIFSKFKKSYDLPLDLQQYRRENSAEYLYS